MQARWLVHAAAAACACAGGSTSETNCPSLTSSKRCVDANEYGIASMRAARLGWRVADVLHAQRDAEQLATGAGHRVGAGVDHAVERTPPADQAAARHRFDLLGRGEREGDESSVRTVGGVEGAKSISSRMRPSSQRHVRDAARVQPLDGTRHAFRDHALHAYAPPSTSRKRGRPPTRGVRPSTSTCRFAPPAHRHRRAARRKRAVRPRRTSSGIGSSALTTQRYG